MRRRKRDTLGTKIDRSDTIRPLIALIPLYHPLTHYHPPIDDGKLTDARKVERSYTEEGREGNERKLAPLTLR